MRSFLLRSFIAILLAGCAQVAEITGGPMDVEAPALVMAEPPHLSTNFSGERITLVFNERIQLDRVRERLLISPPPSKPPVVRLAGSRTVTIDLQEPLLPNTTYSFGIGEAVKDLTEGNPAGGVVHVLSTGPHVDSLLIAGKVTDAFSGDPGADMLVLAHAVGDTGTVRSSRPAYATRTDAQGRFLLDHLRAGEYLLYALRDLNANYRFDLPNEEIAFLDSTVVAAPRDTLLRTQQLRSFTEPAAEQQLSDARVLPDGAFRLVFAKPADSVTVRDITRTGGTLRWLPEWNETKDSLLLWPSDTTAVQQGRYELRTGDLILDTLRYLVVEPMPFFTGVNATLLETADGTAIQLRSARPISEFDSTRIELLMDSVPLILRFGDPKRDLRTLIVHTILEPGTSAVLKLLPGSITDIYGGRNDTVTTGLGRAAEQSTGILQVNIRMNETAQVPFILQLMDRQGIVLRFTTLEDMNEAVIWERVIPGQYSIRMIEDLNANGRWDPGLLDEGLQPERIWRYPEPVNVRASWDLGVDWEIGARPEGDDLQEDTEP